MKRTEDEDKIENLAEENQYFHFSNLNQNCQEFFISSFLYHKTFGLFSEYNNQTAKIGIKRGVKKSLGKNLQITKIKLKLPSLMRPFWRMASVIMADEQIKQLCYTNILKLQTKINFVNLS